MVCAGFEDTHKGYAPQGWQLWEPLVLLPEGTRQGSWHQSRRRELYRRCHLPKKQRPSVEGSSQPMASLQGDRARARISGFTLFLPFALQSPAGASHWPNPSQAGKPESPGVYSIQASFQAHVCGERHRVELQGQTEDPVHEIFWAGHLSSLKSIRNSLCDLSEMVITSPEEQLTYIRLQSSASFRKNFSFSVCVAKIGLT